MCAGMADSPYITAEYNQKGFQNLPRYASVATVFPSPLGIKYFHEEVNVVGYSGTCIQLA